MIKNSAKGFHEIRPIGPGNYVDSSLKNKPLPRQQIRVYSGTETVARYILKRSIK